MGTINAASWLDKLTMKLETDRFLTLRQAQGEENGGPVGECGNSPTVIPAQAGIHPGFNLSLTVGLDGCPPSQT
jgi:hypothetical protein